MKKILMLIDGEHFSEGSFQFVSHLNEQQPILLTGLFLPSVDYSDVSIYYLGGFAGPLYLSKMDAGSDAINKNIERFKALCIKHNIEFRVHSETEGLVLEHVKKETRYADVMILSSELFYSNLGKIVRDEYLAGAMHQAECPVVVVPEQYLYPSSVILAYDGSRASVFAIKQFAYIFPDLAQKSTLMVYASEKESEVPDLQYIAELAARHYQDLTIFKLDADPKKYFNSWVMDKGNALLVTGSFGRSLLSETFKKNFVEDVVGDHKLPVFIAHK